MAHISENALCQNDQFIRSAFHKAVFPCILSILSSNLNILADGILVGQCIGTDGLAAISFCVPISLVLCIIGSFIVSGTAIQASKAIGKLQPELSQALYSTAVILCTALSLLVTAVGLVLIRPLTALLSMGAAPEIQAMTAAYTGITLIGALPKILIYIPFWYLRMDGRASTVTGMMVVMGLGNIALDLIFLYPLGWGVAGAAWASVISTTAACILGFVSLSRPCSNFHFRFTRIRSRALWRNITADGSPSALNNLFQTLRLLVVNALLMQAGGSTLVAAFTAVNCISAFSLCIVDGIPQAASAMLGIYSAEHDHDSIVLLLRQEWRTGLAGCTIFGLIIILIADAIAALYGLDTSLRFAMACLAAGMFPALWCSILSGYYNVSGHVLRANLIIFSRVLLCAAASLAGALALDSSPWWFLLASEGITVAAWYVYTAAAHRIHPEYTRFLSMNRTFETQGRVINFSVPDDPAEICQASARISDFCQANHMDAKQSMRISLAIEELMTLVVQANSQQPVQFDVRVFSLPNCTGIRVRYDGKSYNPFAQRFDRDDLNLLSLQMLQVISHDLNYQQTFGVNTVQILI